MNFQQFFSFYISGSVKAVNPFLERIAKHEQEAYLDDYIDIVVQKKLALDDIHVNSNTCRFLAPYKLLIAYARK